MSIKSQLQEGEAVLYRARPSRVVLLAPLALAVVAGAGAIALWDFSEALIAVWAAIAVALAAIAVALAREAYLRTREYVLTDRRLLRQTGILGKVSMDSYLDKINNVEHRQDLWGRLLHYGDLEIDTASETGAEVFPRISRPLEFKRAIDAAVYAFHRSLVPQAPAVPASPAPPAQPAPSAVAGVAAAPSSSGADRLRQLKKLLDEGLISQAEYEAKRKQLLEEI